MASTIRDIANRAGVSVATVSRVLNGTKAVTPALQKAVLTAVEELDYRPSRLAQSLRSSRTQTISFILSSIQNPFFPELIEHVTRAVGKFGYDVRVSITDSPLAQVVSLHKRKAFDGVLIVGGDSDADALSYIDAHEIPIVAIDRALDSHIPVFTATNEQGAFECTSHLLSHSGARRILHIQGPAHLRICQDRRNGFLQAVAGTNVVATEIEGDFSAESGRRAFAQFLDALTPRGSTTRAEAEAERTKAGADLAPEPALVFADNDLMAIGAMSAAGDNGLVPGRDVLIAGFDGINIAQWVSPALTTYNQPIAAIATAAVNTLLELIDGKSIDREPVEFAGELVVRDSSGGNHE